MRSHLEYLFKSCLSASVIVVNSVNVTESQIGKVCFNSSADKNNRKIRAPFQSDIVFVPSAVAFWNTR